MTRTAWDEKIAENQIEKEKDGNDLQYSGQAFRRTGKRMDDLEARSGGRVAEKLLT